MEFNLDENRNKLKTLSALALTIADSIGDEYNKKAASTDEFGKMLAELNSLTAKYGKETDTL